MTNSHALPNDPISGYLLRLMRPVLSARGYEIARADKVLRSATPKTFTQNYRRPIECIFDIGANLGQSLERYHQFFPRAEITSFEPVKENYEQLALRAAKTPKARALRYALGAKAGDAMIYVPKQTFLSTLMPAGQGEPSQTVPVETLDRIREQLGFGFIDLVKLDVEGFELEVIKGAAQTLSAGKIGMLYIEAGLRDDNTCHTHFGELYATLKPFGYRSFGLYDITRWGESLYSNGPFKNTLFGNALFIHESQAKDL